MPPSKKPAKKPASPTKNPGSSKPAAAKPASKESSSTNPGPTSKNGMANVIWCHAKSQHRHNDQHAQLCTYTDGGVDKRTGVMKLSWNGVVDPMSLDKEHLCPPKIRAKTCPSGFKKEVLKVCNHPHHTCVYAKGQGLSMGVDYNARHKQPVQDSCVMQLARGRC